MDNVVRLALNRRPKPRDLIVDAFRSGKPLPLETMLDNLDYWVRETRRLEASSDPSDTSLARIARHQAQKVAVETAPFVHPKLSSTTVAGDEENPLAVEHRHTCRLGADDLEGKSIKELSQIWLALSSGDNKRIAELVPSIIEEDNDAGK
jgi:hypothetical protein